MKSKRRNAGGEGPGWAAAGVLFGIGVALGSIITRSPVQSRIPLPMSGRAPGGAPRPLPPALLALMPFYIAAAVFPLFLWLARRMPVSRETWLRTLPLWLLAVLGATLLTDIVIMLVRGAASGRPHMFYLFVVRSLATAPVMAGVAILAHAIEQRNRARAAAVDAANARAELAQAQLKSLTAQLRPHFLFNTLQSVSTLIHRDPAAADLMIGRLGELLRSSLELGEAHLIPLREELRIIEAYAGIMRERFGERLHLTIENTADAETPVPPFLLQPLVENAIQYGIEPLPERGQVLIRVRAIDGHIRMDVCNSGKPFTESGTAGIGLRNTRQRLAALYGERARLAVAQGRDGQTCVTIELPSSD